MKSRQKRQATGRTLSAAASTENTAGAKRFVFPLLASLLLTGMVVLLYANSLRNGFVWDDHQQVVMNPDLRPGAPIASLFASSVWGSIHRNTPTPNMYYRPLQMVTYRAVFSFAGSDSLAFHAVSITFAAVSVLVAFAFFWKISGRMDLAFAAAALFAVHPMHSEAVDWISALPDIGCTIFLLASFVFFLFAYEETSPERVSGVLSSPRWLLWTLSLGCFVAALLWKETAAVFPLLIATYVFLFPRENVGILSQRLANQAERNTRLKSLSAREPAIAERYKSVGWFSLPFWIVLAGYLLLRFQVLGAIASSQRNWELSPLGLVLTISNLMATYWWKLIAPVPLNAYHVFSPVTSLADPRAAAGILFLGVAVALVVYGAKRKPLMVFSAAWVLITLLPVMDIYAVGRNVFAERYLYLPSAGFCLLVTLLAFEASQRIPIKFRKWALVSALMIAVLLFASVTVARNSDWKDDATLFGRTLETSPNAPFVHIMAAASASGRSSDSMSAEEHYWKAVSYASAETPPDRAQMALAYKGLASIYSDRSDFNRAIAMLDRAREADPGDPEVDGEEGLILTKAGRWDDAAAYLNRAAASSHDNANVLNALGILAQRHDHQLSQAATHFLKALAAHPEQDEFSASVHNNLGTVYGEAGRYTDAIEQFKAAMAISPQDPEYHTNLATALAASGRYDEARAELQATLAIDPNYEPARAVLRQLGTH